MPIKNSDYNDYMKQYMQTRRKERRNKLIQMAGGECIKCTSQKELEFDHIDPSTKSFQLDARGMDKSWNTILKEFEKCQLLCKNCHLNKSRTNQELGGGHNKKDPTHGTVHSYISHRCRCNFCKEAKRLYVNKEIAYHEVVKVIDPKSSSRGVYTCGTAKSYMRAKCRCRACIIAWNLYNKYRSIGWNEQINLADYPITANGPDC